jgi:monoamine oxidase
MPDMMSPSSPSASSFPAPEVLVIGAGAAGIAAARRLMASGLAPLLIDARDRIGGRAVTAQFGGVPVDLGAHWLHAARSNPLVRLARAEGLEVSRAVYRFRAIKDGKALGLVAGYGLDNAWEKAEERIFDAAERAARRGDDISVAAAVGNVGPWTRAALFMHGNYDCGMEPEQISAVDFSGVEDDRDMLVAGGFGSLIARLGEGLPLVTGAEIVRLTREAGGWRATARDGRSWQAPSVILSLPLMVLKAGGLSIDPAPSGWLDASMHFRAAAYEHAVLKAANAPWSNRHDEIVVSMNGPDHAADNAALFAHIEGTDLHYLDLVAGEGHHVAGLTEEGRFAHLSAKIGRHFGRADGVDILAVTAWAADPFARGAWAMADIGHSAARGALREPFGALIYAGEAASESQWGTVGGAWVEGERAAAQALVRLAGI